MRPELNNVWFFDSDLIRYLLPLSEFICFLNMVKFLLILSDSNLFRDNIGSFFLYSVFYPFCAFVWHRELFFVGNFVVNSIWNFFWHNIWNFMSHCVRNFSCRRVWNFDLNLVWHLSLYSVWDLSCNLDRLERFDQIFFCHVLSLRNLIWHRFDSHDWNFLSNLIFFSHIIGDCKGVRIVWGISSDLFILVMDLCPLIAIC